MNPNPLQSTLARAALAAALVLGVAAPASAQRVVRDAQSGELRAPTASEIAKMETPVRVPRGLVTGTPNPKSVRMADGEYVLESDESMLNYSVVVRLPDGRLVRQCVANGEIAERIARGEVTSFAKNILERLNER